MKRIAVDKGLDNIKAELEKKGYLVEFADDITGDIAAYIYKDSFYPIPRQEGDTRKTDKNKPASQSNVLLVRAQDKDPDQIADILERRLYSPLF
ncbi:MAG: YkuS family protein [Caldicoprobacterales bacterium]|jgi:hypothetical protein|nr:YkuS family protein [Clostridia bacterium]MDI9513331.1 YkuS family protein [Bacillota bacterium]NLH59158.1 hypothetical protein [Clostridiales bacterium]